LNSSGDDTQPAGLAPAEPGLWREQLSVHSYDVDFSQRASAEAICRWFLEAAWNHAEQLGIGYAHLARENRFWVLSRLLIQVHRHPTWGQTMELSTWPRGVSGVFAMRDFELRDNSGRRVVAGSSSWLVLDASNRRPQRLDKLIRNIPAQVARRAADRDPQKLPELKCRPPQPAITTQARYSDIDVNAHVNSARYVGWLLDSYPAEFHRSHLLHSLELNFIGETRWDDVLLVYSQEEDPGLFAHTITTSKQAEVCRAAMVWKIVGGSGDGAVGAGLPEV